jgi:hypothetical protein
MVLDSSGRRAPPTGFFYGNYRVLMEYLVLAENLIRPDRQAIWVPVEHRMSWLLPLGLLAAGSSSAMLLRLTYLAVTNAFALLLMLPMTDREKDVEIWSCATRSRSWNGSWVPLPRFP